MAAIIVDDDIDFSLYERETEAKQNVRSASSYVQALIDRLTNPVREKHFFMPWEKTRSLIQFRPGEVTVWGGESGSGKSLITGQVALSLCAQGERVGIASFEMKPMKTLERMGAQWTGIRIDDENALRDPGERRILTDMYEQFRDWTDGKVWIYDKQGTVQARQVFAVARYCAKELDIKHFFIDSLMKCVADEDDHNGQKAFVDEMCSIARDNNIHIHLIHHVRKPSIEGKKPSKYDFKGTGAVTDQVDNVIGVWRNKVKEKDKQANKPQSVTEPDEMLIVDKQRNGTGWEGYIGLWHHAQSMQFLAGHDAPVMDFYDI